MTDRAPRNNSGHTVRTLDETDTLLERVYEIANDLAEGGRPDRAPRAQMRRAGRRIMNLIDQVDETLGLDE